MMRMGIYQVFLVMFVAAGGLAIIGVIAYSVWRQVKLSQEIQAIQKSLAEIKQELSRKP